jgi:hypothetical protein
MGPTATIIENYRSQHDSGWELRMFSSGYMYKKNPQNEEYTISPPPPTVFLLFADFFTELTGPKYNITSRFWPRVHAILFGLIATPNGVGRARGPLSSIQDPS